MSEHLRHRRKIVRAGEIQADDENVFRLKSTKRARVVRKTIEQNRRFERYFRIASKTR